MKTMDADAIIKRQVDEADSATLVGALMFCKMPQEYQALVKHAAKVMDVNSYIQKLGGLSAKGARAYIINNNSNGSNCIPFKPES